MKIPFLVLVSLVLSCMSGHDIHAQSWRDMQKEADSLSNDALGPAAVRALDLAMEALRLAEEELGPRDTSVANVLLTCAGLLTNASIGRLDEAQTYAERAVAIFEAVCGPDHPRVADALHTLTLTGRYRKDPAEALVLLQRVRSIFERNGMDHSLSFGGVLHSIAFMAQGAGDYYLAKEMYAKSLALQREFLPSEAPSLAYTLTMSATNYWSLGLFHEAEPLLREALHVWQKAYGENSIQSAICLGNLYEHFWRQGNRDEGEAFARRSAELSRKLLPPDDPFFGATLLLAAITLKEAGHYRAAIDSLKRAEAIYGGMKEVSGRIVRTNLWIGECHLALHEYAEAEQRARRGIALRDSLYPGRIERGLDIHLLLARSLAHQGRHREADTLCAEAVAVRRQGLGDDNPAVAAALEARGDCALLAGDVEGSMTYLGQAVDLRAKNFILNARMLPEKDARAYAQFLKRAVDGWLSGYLGRVHPDAGQVASAARIILSTKGQATEQTLLRQQDLSVHTDPATTELLRHYRSVKFQVAKLSIGGLHESMPTGVRTTIDSLGRLSRELEASLARTRSTGSLGPDGRAVTVRDLSAALPPGSSLIEYLWFARTIQRPDTTLPGYLALVLTADGKASIVDLGDAEVIDSTIEVYRAHMKTVEESGMWQSAANERRYRVLAQRLMDLLWTPCAAHLMEGGPVFISPDGGMNLVSFGGLCGRDGRYVIEDFPIHYLAAGRDLLRRDGTRVLTDDRIAFGDPDFGATAGSRRSLSSLAAAAPPDAHAPMLRNVRSDCASFRTAVYARLPGTGTEVRAIMQFWKTHPSRGSFRQFLGSQASEEVFKETVGGKRIIHIATHGYFLEAGRSGREKAGMAVGENPLLRSGVLLAGANLHGADAVDGAEDGVLTALEVSAMDLRGTELVVLSACESGLGSVEQGEGVDGLRRAFQMAGAQTVVSSLWRVPDAETVKFMKALYAGDGLSYPEMMRRAAVRRIAEARVRGRSTHPFTWAGFMAMGEWRNGGMR